MAPGRLHKGTYLIRSGRLWARGAGGHRARASRCGAAGRGVAAPCPWVLVRVGRGGPGAPHAGTESPGGWGLGLPEGSTA